MQLRKLGRSQLEVAPLFLGGNVFGWTSDEATSFAVLDAYVDAGGNSIDTADVYSAWAPGNAGGESETVIGNWLKARGKRDKVIIATKLGSPMGPDKYGLSRKYIFEAIEASLRRLQTDYIDLYQAHRDDAETPLEETLQVFNELVQQGKVRSIGASNYDGQRLAQALRVSEQHGYARYESLQPFYNLVGREQYEQDLESLCREQEVGVITYSSLASGFLAGKYRSGQELPSSPRSRGVKQQYMNEKGFSVLAAVERIAQVHGATPSQAALAWVIARSGITAPIVSATSVEQMHELLGAVDLKLRAEDIAALNAVSNWRT